MSDEEIRSLERAVLAQPGAASWSGLATALARAGRAGEASRAALRAVAFDPEAGARALILPSWAGDHGSSRLRAVGWSGMRRLARVRPIHGVPGGPVRWDMGPAVVEVQGGRAVWRAGNELLGVDVLAGRVLWRRPASTIVGSLGSSLLVASLEDGKYVADTQVLETLDTRTGEPLRRVVLGGPLRANLQLLGPYVFAEGLDGTHVLDAETGRSIRTFSGSGAAGLLGGQLMLVQSTGDGFLVARDLDEREVWRTPFDGRPAGQAIGAQLLVPHVTSERGFGLFDLATGTHLGTLAPPAFAQELSCVNEDVVVFAHRERPMVHDRRSLALLWSRLDRLGRTSRAALTGDAFLEVMGDQELELVSVDPRTGEELSRVSLAAWGPLPVRSSRVGGRPIRWRFEVDLALVAGRVLIFSRSDVRPLLIVEDALA